MMGSMRNLNFWWADFAKVESCNEEYNLCAALLGEVTVSN